MFNAPGNRGAIRISVIRRRCRPAAAAVLEDDDYYCCINNNNLIDNNKWRAIMRRAISAGRRAGHGAARTAPVLDRRKSLAPQAPAGRGNNPLMTNARTSIQ